MQVKIPEYIEVVCQTEYQDIYRIKPYVLLVVDKFSNSISGDGHRTHFNQYTKPYSKGTESNLRVSKDIGDNRIYYNDWEVHITTPDKYRFKLKTSGDAFNGNLEEFNRLMSCCNNIVQSYYGE